MGHAKNNARSSRVQRMPKILARDTSPRPSVLVGTQLVFVNDKGKRIGEGHHRAKLADADVDLVLYLRDAGLSYQAIADKFDDIPGGISKYTIRDYVKGRRRAQVPYATKRVPKR